jgi:hypothetical protein
MNSVKLHIQAWLQKKPTWIFAFYASLTAFLTYSCMYAFRKPFTVGNFAGLTFFHVDYKIWLITAQAIGYTVSKFWGIEYVSELKKSGRAVSVLVLISFAESALILFALIPRPYNIIFLFFNGLPLGMIWGIVFSYLEGRKLTELLGAGLCASFILASGFVKSVGQWVFITFHTSEFVMPCITGMIFAVPLIISICLLDCLPLPDSQDEMLRTKRLPMNGSQRRAFISYFLIGLILLIIAYTVLTIFRELRDNFSAEIWKSLGYQSDPAIFTIAELPVAFLTLLSLAAITFIKSNFKAFNLILYIVLAGFLLISLASVLYNLKIIPGEVWMIAVGTGLYLGYVPFNAFLYERLIAAFKYVSNVGFVIYVSDAIGYLGSLGVLFYKNFFNKQTSWMNFFIHTGFWFSLLGIFLVILAIFYFNHKFLLFKNTNHELSSHVSAEPLFTVNAGPAYHEQQC